MKPFTNEPRNFSSGNLINLGPTVNVLVSLIQKEPYFLKHCLRVSSENRMLTALNELSVQLRSVSHIKVTQYHKAASLPVTPSKKRMTRSFLKFTRSAIPKMPHQDFSSKVKKSTHITWIIWIYISSFTGLIIAIHQLSKNDSKRIP